MDADHTRRHLDLPAGPIHYREAGPADGRPVVLVHGFLVDDTVWGDVPERLGSHGLRAIAPTWPLGAHRTPMHPGADLSPKGQAQVVLALLEALDLHDVVLVGNDTGGAVCQLVLDADASRVGAVVLTNCDAFTTFPPAPFKAVFRAGRHPRLAGLLLGAMRWRALRHSPLGLGLLAHHLDPELTAGWFAPSIGDRAIRQDVARFLRGVRPAELDEATSRLDRFEGAAAVVWGEDDRAFRPRLGRRLAAAFRDARFVPIAGAKTLVSLDAPDRLVAEIAATAGVDARTT